MTPVKHRTKQLAIERLTHSEHHKEKLFWPREMKILAKLIKGREDDRFWAELNVGYQMHSLAHFVAPEGAAVLERHWRLHQLATNQTPTVQIPLDLPSNPTTIPTIESPARKQNPLEWASS